MSGRGDQEPTELATAGPFVHGYLSKPFRIDQLTATCVRVLSVANSVLTEARVLPDRRRDSRRNLVVPATLVSPTGTPIAAGELHNVTIGGAEFDLGASLRPGTEMPLSFEIPGGRGPFLIPVGIRWNQAGRLGLVFLHLSDDDRRRLAALLA